MEINEITKEQLRDLLEKTDATRLQILFRGEVKMNKTNNPFYKKEERSWVAKDIVEKQTLAEYEFGGDDYEERIIEAFIQDGSAGGIRADKLPWGEWSVFNKVIEYKGNYYVRCYVNQSNPLDSSVSYYVNGKRATEDEVETIKKFTPNKPEGSKRQFDEGLDYGKHIIPLNIDFGKIIQIKVGETTYTIV